MAYEICSGSVSGTLSDLAPWRVCLLVLMNVQLQCSIAGLRVVAAVARSVSMVFDKLNIISALGSTE